MDRRTLLRATVWAAPVVLIAAPAPAMAASAVGDAVINLSGGFWVTVSAGQLQSIDGTAKFQSLFSNTANNVTSATLTITLPAAGMVAAAPTVTSGASQWAGASGSLVGTDMVYTIAWFGDVDPSGPEGSTQVAFSLPGQGNVADAGFPKGFVASITSPQAMTDTKSGTINTSNDADHPITFG